MQVCPKTLFGQFCNHGNGCCQYIKQNDVMQNERTELELLIKQAAKERLQLERQLVEQTVSCDISALFRVSWNFAHINIAGRRTEDRFEMVLSFCFQYNPMSEAQLLRLRELEQKNVQLADEVRRLTKQSDEKEKLVSALCRFMSAPRNFCSV